MDVLASLPDTRAGHHTKWLWSWILGVASGSGPPDSAELANRFDPWILEQVSAEQPVVHYAQLAPMMTLVTQLIEEVSCEERYSALLRYTRRMAALFMPSGRQRFAPDYRGGLHAGDEPGLLLRSASQSQWSRRAPPRLWR